MSQSKASEFFKSMEEVAGQQTQRKNPGDKSTAETYVPPGSEKKPEAEETPEQPAQPTVVVDEAKVRASGKTGAYLTSGLMEMVFGFGERLIFLSKFNLVEKEMIVALDEKPENKWTDEEKRVHLKFLALTKKHDKIRERIPLTAKDEEILAEGFSEYTRITGKSLNPTLIIWSTIIKTMVNRGIDLFM